MKLIWGEESTKKIIPKSAVTFGNFDGLHLGHQALLKRLKQRAKERNLPVVVVLFEPQTNEFFNKTIPLARMSSLRDKLAILKTWGIDFVYVIRFTKEVALQSAQSFVLNTLFTKLNAAYILLGEDARFGHNRQGDASFIQALSEANGAIFEVFQNYLENDARVSSTAIRSLLEKGDFEGASLLLGRSYSVYGRVVYGEGRGRQLGFPTANISVHLSNPVLKGVYVVEVTKQDGSIFQGVANWGLRPSFGSQLSYHLEVHGLDLFENLYGQFLTVRFIKKIREEMRFENKDALTQQIRQDIESARACHVSQGAINL